MDHVVLGRVGNVTELRSVLVPIFNAIRDFQCDSGIFSAFFIEKIGTEALTSAFQLWSYLVM